MLRGILGVCGITLLVFCCGTCDQPSQQPIDYQFPTAPPIWIVEVDPEISIFDRTDLDHHRGIDGIMVIPLYMDYRYEGETDNLAIAHPFVCEPGEEIEEHLASFGQREKLRSLIVWAPGYFPGAIGRTFPLVPVINGKRMILLDLQPCLGSEQSEIDAAMETLLQDDFVIAKWIVTECPPRVSHQRHERQITNTPYDAAQLVRSEGYDFRFFDGGSRRGMEALWGFNAGTRIVNRLSPEDKKMVAEFAEQAAEKAKKSEDVGDKLRNKKNGPTYRPIDLRRSTKKR